MKTKAPSNFGRASSPFVLPPGWVDAHCHLADPRSEAFVEEWIAEAKEQNLCFFLQGGVGPEDWQRQKVLAAKFPEQMGLCFGVHPYFVATHSPEECEEALDELARVLPMALALGELGLDFRPHVARGSEDLQIQIFESQLELAEASQKPVIFHIVQAHEEALKILDLWGVPPRGGFVHSFNGSSAKADEFLRRGLSLSVGGPLLRPENEKLRQAVRSCPLEFLLVETDSPDQSPPSSKNKLNPPTTLFEVAEEIARLKKMSTSEILTISKENLNRILN